MLVFSNQPQIPDRKCLVDVRVQRTKVALYAAHLLFEDAMPETRFELALSQRSGRDAHRLLTTTEKNLCTPQVEHIFYGAEGKGKRT